MSESIFNWKQYHTQRAAEYRRIAESWRKDAEGFRADGNHDFAAFANHRANINDDWAKEAQAAADKISETATTTNQNQHV